MILSSHARDSTIIVMIVTMITLSLIFGSLGRLFTFVIILGVTTLPLLDLFPQRRSLDPQSLVLLLLDGVHLLEFLHLLDALLSLLIHLLYLFLPFFFFKL